MDGIVLRIHDDLYALAFLAGNAADACRRTQTVHVGILVAHDIDLLGIVDQLAQRIGHHAGFHLRALLRGLGAPAVKVEIQPVLDHGLVTAAGQRHFQCHGGILEQLLKAVAVAADTDGQRGRHALTGHHLAHTLQKVEAFFGIAGIVLFLKNEQEPVAVIAQQQAVGGCGPFIELFLQRRQHRRALAFRAGLHQLLVVVDHQNGHNRLRHFQRLTHLLQLGHIHPVGGGQRLLAPAHLAVAADGAEHAIYSVIPHDQLRTLPLIFQYPVGVELRHHCLHMHIKQLLALAG